MDVGTSAQEDRRWIRKDQWEMLRIRDTDYISYNRYWKYKGMCAAEDKKLTIIISHGNLETFQ